jgi:hypothetical protein
MDAENGDEQMKRVEYHVLTTFIVSAIYLAPHLTLSFGIGASLVFTGLGIWFASRTEKTE